MSPFGDGDGGASEPSAPSVTMAGSAGGRSMTLSKSPWSASWGPGMSKVTPDGDGEATFTDDGVALHVPFAPAPNETACQAPLSSTDTPVSVKETLLATCVLEFFQLGARLMSRQTSAHPLNERV